MTISELLVALQNRRKKYGDLEVEVTWEGITRAIDTTSIYARKDGPLYIDADENRYKVDFAIDPHEGEGKWHIT